MEQLHFRITKTTKNFNQQHDCAMNNTRKIYVCQKICRTYINKLRVQIHELQVPIHELWVRIQELRVQIHELEDWKHELQD